MRFFGTAMALSMAALALGACSQDNAPSEKLAKEADSLVQAATGSEPAGETAIAGPYAPRNECSELQGAGPFVAMLRGAVAGRDAEALAVLAAQDVKLGNDTGASGRAELLNRLNAPDGALWASLDQLMTLGCAANAQGGITLPWYFAQADFPVDKARGYIVTGDKVPLRDQPDEATQPISQLGWQAVELLPDDEQVEGWRHVRLPAADGEEEKTGWVRDTALRPINSLRLVASSRNKTWRITSLVSGA